MTEYKKYGAVCVSLISSMTAREVYSVLLVSGILSRFCIKGFFFCSGDGAPFCPNAYLRNSESEEGRYSPRIWRALRSDGVTVSFSRLTRHTPHEKVDAFKLLAFTPVLALAWQDTE